MDYEATLQYRNLNIDFEFALDGSCEGLVIASWSAFDLMNKEVNIPCKVEADYIEKLIEEQLEKLWSREGNNYVQDYKDYLGDKMFDYYSGR